MGYGEGGGGGLRLHFALISRCFAHLRFTPTFSKHSGESANFAWFEPVTCSSMFLILVLCQVNTAMQFPSVSAGIAI